MPLEVLAVKIHALRTLDRPIPIAQEIQGPSPPTKTLEVKNRQTYHQSDPLSPKPNMTDKIPPPAFIR
jgi:hypothetical protein